MAPGVIIVLLFIGYVLAASFFFFGRKSDRETRLVLAFLAGVALALQTYFWHFLLALGASWNSGHVNGWLIWGVSAAIYFAIAIPFVARPDRVIGDSKHEPERVSPTEEYGPLR